MYFGRLLEIFLTDLTKHIQQCNNLIENPRNTHEKRMQIIEKHCLVKDRSSAHKERGFSVIFYVDCN